jgi:hypothetical protein
MKTEKNKPSKPIIGFRYSRWPFASLFFKTVQDFEIDQSELARLAIEKGLAAATEELNRRKMSERDSIRRAQEEIEKSRKMVRDTGFEPVTPTVSRLLQALVPHSHSHSVA